VCIIKEGEILSLANLFSNDHTNIIQKDSIDKKEVDEHPLPHLRVLLAIEVGRKLGIKSSLLGEIQKKWIAHGGNIIKDKVRFKKEKYPMQPFVDNIDKVAKALVETGYEELKGYSVKDIFANFNSALAKELRKSINQKWILKVNGNVT
jgi:hypothetical protein